MPINYGRSQYIGIYHEGEIPEPLEYQFLRSESMPFNLTGYTAKWVVKDPSGTETEYPATVSDALDGKVTGNWSIAMTDVVSEEWSGAFWIEQGSQKIGSDILNWKVISGPGPV